jgi:hypothetical protein
MRTNQHTITPVQRFWALTALAFGPAVLLCALTEAAAIVHPTPPTLNSKPVLAMLDSVVVVALIAVAAIVVFMKSARKKRHDHLLDAAWNEVLNDPHYTERRRVEERKHVVEKERELVSLGD